MDSLSIYDWVVRWRDAHGGGYLFPSAPFYKAWKNALVQLGEEVGIVVNTRYLCSSREADRLVAAGADVHRIVAIARLLDPENTTHDLRR